MCSVRSPPVDVLVIRDSDQGTRPGSRPATRAMPRAGEEHRGMVLISHSADQLPNPNPDNRPCNSSQSTSAAHDATPQYARRRARMHAHARSASRVPLLCVQWGRDTDRAFASQLFAAPSRSSTSALKVRRP